MNGITIQTDALASSNNVISGGTPLGLNLQFGNAIVSILDFSRLI